MLSMKRSTEFDQTLSLPPESLAHKTRLGVGGVKREGELNFKYDI